MPTSNHSAPSSGTASISWEYLMPKRKERMASYIRESDESLADSTTIESAAKACREYGAKEGYVHDTSRHEFKEAISAYTVPYNQRRRLLDMLKAAERHEFDVLVVTEIRAISRRQVEVLVIYDMLQKYGVRLETIKEKFGDDAMSKAILSLRAMFVEIEREQSYFRMQRGKLDRVEIGQALNGHGHAAYGHVFVDSEREQKATYGLDTRLVYTDPDGKDWTPVNVIRLMRDCLLQGKSVRSIAITLTEMGIPSPETGKKRKGILASSIWSWATVYRILIDPRIMGKVYANRYHYVEGKRVVRPKEQWVRLPDCPPIISPEDFDAIQKQLRINKEESPRNTNQEHGERGLFRAGYALCGVCGGRMTVRRHLVQKGRYQYDEYTCRAKTGKTESRYFHAVSINQTVLDKEGWNRAVEVICNPTLVRERVAIWREKNTKTVVDRESIENTIAGFDQEINNLFTLAQKATTDDTINRLAQIMNNLEEQKQQAIALLYDADDEDEEQVELEKEIARFEQWAENVRPKLADPSYVPDRDEQRLAIRILGLRCTVFPANGNTPYRYQFELAPPEIMKLLSKHCVAHEL